MILRLLLWLRLPPCFSLRGLHQSHLRADRHDPSDLFPIARIRSFWYRLCRRFYGRRWFRRNVFWRI